MVTFSWIRSGVILAPSPEQKVFQTEEKFQNPEQIQPRTVIIANSNGSSITKVFEGTVIVKYTVST